MNIFFELVVLTTIHQKVLCIGAVSHQTHRHMSNLLFCLQVSKATSCQLIFLMYFFLVAEMTQSVPVLQLKQSFYLTENLTVTLLIV